MTTKTNGLCQYEACLAKATHIACDRSDGGHPNLGIFCREHAYIVTDTIEPDYQVECPNCGYHSWKKKQGVQSAR